MAAFCMDIVDEETKSNKPQSLELTGGRKRVSAETDAPLSPTHYAQPPTPDCPPPSPSTALQGIQQKINPQVWKRQHIPHTHGGEFSFSNCARKSHFDSSQFSSSFLKK